MMQQASTAPQPAAEQESPLEHIVQHPLDRAAGQSRPAHAERHDHGLFRSDRDDRAGRRAADRARADAGQAPARAAAASTRWCPPAPRTDSKRCANTCARKSPNRRSREHTDRFIKYIWSVFFFVLTVNILGLLPIPVVSKLFGTHLGGTAIGQHLDDRDAGHHDDGHDGRQRPSARRQVVSRALLSRPDLDGAAARARRDHRLDCESVRAGRSTFCQHDRRATSCSRCCCRSSSRPARRAPASDLASARLSLLGSVAINFLELFVAFLQAFIFTFLTTLFIGMSVVLHHDDHGEEHGHGQPLRPRRTDAANWTAKKISPCPQGSGRMRAVRRDCDGNRKIVAPRAAE